jgi:hypothetical protein
MQKSLFDTPFSITQESTGTKVARCCSANITEHQGDHHDDNHQTDQAFSYQASDCAGTDDSAAKNVPGVQKIVVLDDLVAVVGDHMWAAKKGLDALKIDWDGGPHGQLSSNDIWE